MQRQMDVQKEMHQEEMHQEEMEAQRKAHKEQLEAVMAQLSVPHDSAPIMAAASVPSFAPFDPTSKLWKDYRVRFDTFAGANSIPNGKMAQVFFTNKTPATYTSYWTPWRDNRPHQKG